MTPASLPEFPAASLPEFPAVSLPEFPPEAQRIVERWDPDGLRAWRAQTAPSRAVRVVAVPGIDATPLLDALASFDPVLGSSGGAAVVVTVLDAASVLGRDELSALDEAAADVERVIFALTGPGGAGRDAVRDRDEALLRAHAARYADVRVLTDLTAVAAAVGDVLASDSAERAERDHRRGASSLVERTCRRIVETARTVRDDGDTATADLRARKARLVAGRDGGRGERLARLRGEVQRARVDLVHEAGARMRAVSIAARSEIDRAGRRELRAFPDRMSDLVERATVDLDGVVARRLADLVDHAGVPEVSAAAPPPPEPPLDGPEPRHRGVEDRLMVLVGASAGVGLGRLAVAPVTMVPALDIATIPITLTLGGVAAWWIARARRLVADRAHLRRWASDTTAHVRSQLEQRVLGRLLETEADVSARVLADCRVAAAAIDEELAGVDAEARRLAAERSGRLASCERDRAALAAVLDALAGRPEPSGGAVRPIP